MRRASVNSFEYEDANVHTILEAVDSFISDYQVAKAQAKTNSFTDQKNDNSVKWQHMNGMNDNVNDEIIIDMLNLICESFCKDKFLLIFSAHNESILRSNIAAIKKKKREL